LQKSHRTKFQKLETLGAANQHEKKPSAMIIEACTEFGQCNSAEKNEINNDLNKEPKSNARKENSKATTSTLRKHKQN
jgi:hypothetical protein